MTIESAISRISPTNPRLPFSHVTQVSGLIDFFDNFSIDLHSKCPATGESVCYLFYGAPFFKIPKGRDNKESIFDQVASHAAGLLLPANILKDIKTNIYPFDTGAKANGKYFPYLSSDTGDLKKYLVNSLDASTDAAKIVSLLFGGSNRCYVNCSKEHSVGDSDNKSDCVTTLMELQNAKELDADERRQAIEVVVFASIPLKLKDKVIAIVPKNTIKKLKKIKKELDKEKNIDLLIEWLEDGEQVEVVEYNDKETYYSPTAESEVIYDRAISWLDENGRFDQLI